MRAALFLLASSLLAGCSGDDDGDSCFIGSRDAPVELEIVVRGADGAILPAGEGAEVPILKPPQGGKVVFVGARARNLDGCGVQARGALIDDCTNRPAFVVSQPVNLSAGADGWGVPRSPADISDWVNLSACPYANATRDVEGEPYQIELTVTDKGGRTATRRVRVVPVCAEPDLEQECKCECDHDYQLGEACTPEPDGGPPPGQCADGGMG